jgi:mRNA-degrading endonuclease RelE of RelBE toxin-antitoxin system
MTALGGGSWLERRPQTSIHGVFLGVESGFGVKKLTLSTIAFDVQGRGSSPGGAASARIHSCVTGSSSAKRPASSCGLWKNRSAATSDHRMELIRDDLQGDLKKLETKGNRYRLRIDSHRVLFTLEHDQIAVYAVKDRTEACE